MARVLITGGSGFIGTNLVEHYLRLGRHMLALDVGTCEWHLQQRAAA